MEPEKRGRGWPAPAAAVAEARRLFEGSSLNVSEISRLAKLPRSTVQSRALAEGWVRQDPFARRNLVAGVREKIEREMAAVQSTLGQHGEARVAQAERAARTLASLVRTLRELAKYDAEQSAAARGKAADDEIVDPDEFYRELSRRIDDIRQRRA